MLADGDPKVILVNSNDGIRPRLFTLLHEYAHLLLRSNGICVPNSGNFQYTPTKHDELMERWCNNFAGAVIMPKKEFLNTLRDYGDIEPSKIVDSLATKFCTSKAATVVRILNLTGQNSQKQAYLEHYNEIISKPVPKTGGGGGSGRDMAQECLNRYGMPYVRLVFDSKNRDLITIDDMVKYLNLKTKYFEDLAQKFG